MLQFLQFNRRTHVSLMSVFILLLSCFAVAHAAEPWQQQPKGHYRFQQWAGGELEIHFSVPADSHAATPILLVIPGARRNAEEYRDHWHPLAIQRGFIVLTLGCSVKVCDSEYLYNLGGTQDPQGQPVPVAKQLFSALELVFNDFVARFGSEQQQFSLYGHSAGGGFVHLYMLMRPDAPVSRAVAANPAFFTMPDLLDNFPFGLKNTVTTPEDVDQWLAKPLTIMLGDQDMGPRSKPLSDSPRARQQGLNVFSRGLSFYASSMNWAAQRQVKTQWKLEVVQDVGHSSAKITPHALKYLFNNQVGQ